MIRLNPGDIISIKSPNNPRYFITIILTKQVLFGANLCACFPVSQDHELTYTEFLDFQKNHQWEYRFIDFHDAKQDKTLSKIHTGFPVNEIFCGEIKQKVFLHEFDVSTSIETVSSHYNDRERIEEKEIEGIFSGAENVVQVGFTFLEVIDGDVKDTYREDLNLLKLFAYHEQLVKDEKYFYQFSKIDKLGYFPHALVKSYAQTEREKQVPEIPLQGDFIYYRIKLYEK